MTGKLLSILLPALLALGISAPAPAAEPPMPSGPELPEHYPERFDRTGFVTDMDIRGGRLGVDARRYRLDSGVRVHTPGSRFGSVHALRPETPVGLILVRDGDGEAVIVEIWVLPDEYIRPT